MTLLLSFYNPNRLEAHIHTASAYFTWAGRRVGTWELETGLTLIAKPGSIMDYRMAINFKPSFSDAHQMYQAYSNKSLVLGMGLHIGGSLKLYGIHIHEFDR